MRPGKVNLPYELDVKSRVSNKLKLAVQLALQQSTEREPEPHLPEDDF